MIGQSRMDDGALLVAGAIGMARGGQGCRNRRRLPHSFARTILCSLLLVCTSACMLVSGDRVSTDLQPDGGNVTRTFLGAEGNDEHALAIGGGATTLQVIAIIEAQQGEVLLEMLHAGGSVAFAVRSRPGDQVSRSGLVQLDETGTLRYRVYAHGARDGGYQILYQRVRAVEQ